MKNNTVSLRTWINFTIVTGLGALASYTIAAFVPLPEKISLIFAFAFGPFFMMASLGTYRIIQFWKDSLVLQVGTLFNIAGTAFVTMMLVVQQTSFAFHETYKSAERGTVTDEQLRWIFKEVNSIQLGMDLTWDIFISVGTFCLALGIYGHPVYKKILSMIGIIAAALLLTFNMIYFPVPPGDAGSIDFGPLVALWYSALTILLLIKRRKFEEVFGWRNSESATLVLPVLRQE